MPHNSHASRYTIIETSDALFIDLPAPRIVPTMLLLGVGLAGWVAGLALTIATIYANRSASLPEILFLLLWLAGWMFCGLLGIYSLLWMAIGREKVTLTGERLTVRRDLRGYGKDQVYKLAYIEDLRATPDQVGLGELTTSLRLFGIGGGKIAFDYIGLVCRFGAGLDEAEAGALVEQLRKRHPLS